jgi:hypothetical protein
MVHTTLASSGWALAQKFELSIHEESISPDSDILHASVLGDEL